MPRSRIAVQLLTDVSVGFASVAIITPALHRLMQPILFAITAHVLLPVIQVITLMEKALPARKIITMPVVHTIPNVPKRRNVVRTTACLPAKTRKPTATTVVHAVMPVQVAKFAAMVVV